MILISGAAGKTGKAVIGALAARGKRVRALVRCAKDGEALASLGQVEVMAGDLAECESIRQAMRGVEAAYLIFPNMTVNEIEMGSIAIEAARTCGVKHLVYHSVLHPQVEAMPHHWNKMRVEELIFASGLNFTILQPTAYMQNMLAYWNQIRKEGAFALPYSAESRISLVDLTDVAEVAAKVLGNAEHFGATYELVGTLPLSQHEVAQVIGKQLGRQVRAVTLDRQEWAARASQSGMSAYAVNTLRMMFEYYEAHGLCGNPQVISMLLGRAPISLSGFIKRMITSGE